LLAEGAFVLVLGGPRLGFYASTLYRIASSWLRHSESFTNGAKLLAAAERMVLEGVVCKMAVTAHGCGCV